MKKFTLVTCFIFITSAINSYTTSIYNIELGKEFLVLLIPLAIMSVVALSLAEIIDDKKVIELSLTKITGDKKEENETRS